jgi:hypothetical protein
MGKVAGAAVTAAAPEAAVARKLTTGMSRDEVTGELQRRRQVAAVRKRQRDRGLSEGQTQDEADAAAPAAPAAAPAAPPSPGGGQSLPGMPAAASTGSGFLLGVFAWAVGLAYLRGGWAGVRQFGAAKFLNRTGGSA